MHKIALITLFTFPLFAGFFPEPIHTSIKSIEGKSITLAKSLPLGMSGVVIHNYGNDIEAATSRLVQNSATSSTLIKDNIVQHDKLPSISTISAKGDKVIGGYLYNNILLLAPDAKTYAMITNETNKNWIHPDLYALFLESNGENVPTKKNLKDFAKAYQVGLIYIIAKDSAKLLDPISGKIISQKLISALPIKGKAPFYMRFPKIKTALFSSKNTKSYYKIMEQF